MNAGFPAVLGTAHDLLITKFIHFEPLTSRLVILWNRFGLPLLFPHPALSRRERVLPSSPAGGRAGDEGAAAAFNESNTQFRDVTWHGEFQSPDGDASCLGFDAVDSIACLPPGK